MMKFLIKNVVLFLALMFLCLLTPQAGHSEMSNYELEQKVKELEKRLGVTEEGKEPGVLEKLSDRITISGAIELDFSYADDSDTGDNTINDSTSDLDIGTAELGVEIAFHEYVTGNLVLKGENLDSDSNVFWDEAAITILKEGFPLYFIGGKRTQPFGLFESHLINDPITQDCYEINKTGATLGFIPKAFALDISFTAYRGEELMTHMLEGAYNLDRTYFDIDTAAPAGWRNGGAGGMSPGYAETDNVSSYIANITIEPVEGLILAAYFDSEPGDGDRNETIGGTFHFEYSKFTLDAEYIGAVQREKDPANNQEYEESAWFVSLAFQVLDPLEIAARYEVFDDGIPGEQDGNLEDRFSIGATYTLFEKGGFKTNLMAEYRASSMEMRPGNPGNVDDSLREFFARLAIEF